MIYRKDRQGREISIHGIRMYEVYEKWFFHRSFQGGKGINVCHRAWSELSGYCVCISGKRRRQWERSSGKTDAWEKVYLATKLPHYLIKSPRRD